MYPSTMKQIINSGKKTPRRKTNRISESGYVWHLRSWISDMHRNKQIKDKYYTGKTKLCT